MKKTLFLSVILICAFAALNPAFATKGDLTAYLPKSSEIGKWKRAEPVEIFAGEDLFLFIDGGAGIYFEYGFIQAAACQYSSGPGTSIKCELYEMKDAGGAYGMYTINSGHVGTEVNIGDEGRWRDYYIIFWRGKFLVYLVGSDTTAETKEGMLSIAEALDKSIKEPGRKPTLAGYLPQDSLLSEKYIRGVLGLSSVYIFDAKNIFQVTEGVIGEYPGYKIFVFRYATPRDAGRCINNAKKSVALNPQFTGFSETGLLCMARDRKGGRICFGQVDENILVALVEKESDVSKIYDMARKHIESKRGREKLE